MASKKGSGPIRKAVVTGGGSGLGKEICLVLSKKKAKLLIADIHLDNAQKTADEAIAMGAAEAHAMVCDVRKVEDVERMCSESVRILGGVDLLVNNAGVVAAGASSELNLKDWNWVVETNLWGVIYGCHVFLPMMKKQGGGRILNIASAAGLLSPPEMAPYNVTKAGVISLSETLHAEFQDTGVSLTVACPMFFASSLISHARIADSKSLIMAQKLVSNSPNSASKVARACIRAVERNQLYVLPSLLGNLIWLSKRMMPETFSKGMVHVSQRWKDWFVSSALGKAGHDVSLSVKDLKSSHKEV